MNKFPRPQLACIHDYARGPPKVDHGDFVRRGDVGGTHRQCRRLVHSVPLAAHEDEFVYVVRNPVVLVPDAGETMLDIGDCAGFEAGERDGHHPETAARGPL